MESVAPLPGSPLTLGPDEMPSVGTLAAATMGESALCQNLEAFALPAGAVLYEAETVGIGCFVLVDGSLQVSDEMPHTLAPSLAGLVNTPGTLLSRGSLLEPFLHRHRVVALTDSRLVLLRRARFEDLLAAGDRGAQQLLDFLLTSTMDELRTLNQAVFALMQPNAP